MHALRCAIAHTVDGGVALAPQIILGTGSGGLQQLLKQTDENVDFYWLRSLAPFSYLQQMGLQSEESIGGDGQDVTSKLISELRHCKSVDEANEVAQSLLILRIAKHISIPTSDINTDKTDPCIWY